MRKIILTITIVLGISSFVNAQIEVGVGLMEGSNSYGSLAIEGKANFGITEKIEISPSVDFFFPTTNYVYGSEDKASLLLTISVDGHYAFPINDKFEAYGLVGANFLLSNIDDDNWYWDYYDFGPKLYVNVGGGATYTITEKMKVYLELKYTRFGPTASAGILFSL